MDFEARRVLLCLRYGIGDVVMEMPIVEALRRAVPGARITVLGASPALELLEGSPLVDEVESLTGWGIRHRWDDGPPGFAPMLSGWLDRHGFDLFLDVHHVTPAFAEAVWRRGVRSLEADEEEERRALQEGADGVAAIRAAVRAGWGLDVDEATPRIEPRRWDREFAEAFFRSRRLDDLAPVGVSPVASHPLKRWPPAKLARVIDWVNEASGAPILLFQGPQGRVADEIREQIRDPDRLIPVGPHRLLRVAALLERCRAFLCNDTGLMHLAAALGVPTVAVFGPTAPSVYRPPGPLVIALGGDRLECGHRNTTSLHPPACFGAGRCLLDWRGCIDHVSEGEVIEALAGLLGLVSPVHQETVA